MFIEPSIASKQKGWIEVICGSMFSGKTEELIRRLRRAQIANQRVEIFKPTIDKRYDEESVVSHNKNSIASTPVENSQAILLLAHNVNVVGIDEAQFFDENLPDVCEQLAKKGLRVVVAGLDKDFLGKPFGCMPYILALGDYVTKLHAICVRCGDLATHSFRKTNNSGTILIGETESYEPRCRNCYYQHNTK
ncbi:MAG: thymidine kinase [Sphingobacteriales bacterium]|nr:thymidine kinase [Sphingobacteriales bacterium]